MAVGGWKLSLTLNLQFGEACGELTLPEEVRGVRLSFGGSERNSNSSLSKTEANVTLIFLNMSGRLSLSLGRLETVT